MFYSKGVNNPKTINKIRQDQTLSLRIAKEDKDFLKLHAQKVSMPLGEFTRALLDLAMEDYLNAANGGYVSE